MFAPIPVVPDAKECEVFASPINPHPLRLFCSNSCRRKARFAPVIQAERVCRREPVGPPNVIEDPGAFHVGPG